MVGLKSTPLKRTILLITAIMSICIIQGSHFGGGTISWKPISDLQALPGFLPVLIPIHCKRLTAFPHETAMGDVEELIVEFQYKMGHLESNCESMIGKNDSVGGSWSCSRTSDCDFDAVGKDKMRIITCEDQQWMTGENMFGITFSNKGPFTIQYTGSAWVDTVFGSGGNWRVATDGDLRVRSDTHRPNSSPVVSGNLYFRVEINCVIKVNVYDPDGDTIRCEWANTTDCPTCKGRQIMTLNEQTCILVLNDKCTTTYGLYSVAISVKDYPTTAITYEDFPYSTIFTSDSLSSVPYQFVVNVTNSSRCNPQPPSVYPTPSKDNIIEIRSGQNFTILATCNIIKFVIDGIPNANQSPIRHVSSPQSKVAVDVTWIPHYSELLNVCLRVENYLHQTSESYCVKILEVTDDITIANVSAEDSRVQVIENIPTTIMCQTSSYSSVANITWIGIPEIQHSSVTRVVNKTVVSQLHFTPTRSLNGTEVQCHLKDHFGLIYSAKRNATLNVKVAPSDITISSKPEELDVVHGDTVSFSCDTSFSDPPPTIRWFLYGESVTNDDNNSFIQTNGSFQSHLEFTVVNITNPNITIYCQASNLPSVPRVESDHLIITLHCDNVSVPENAGVTRGYETTYKSLVTYSCTKGYVLKGNVERGCTANGYWSGFDPDCVEKNQTTITCPLDIDERRTNWSETLAGQIQVQTCARGFAGNVKRLCKPDGRWQMPFYNCIRDSVLNIFQTVDSLNTNSSKEELEGILSAISNVTDHSNSNETASSLTAAELTSITHSLGNIAAVINSSDTIQVDVDLVVDSFMASASNLLDSTNEKTWMSVKQSNDEGAEAMFSAIDTMGAALRNHLANTSNDSVKVVKKNIAFEVKKLKNGIVFPEPHHTSDDWIKRTQSQIRLDALPFGVANDSFIGTAVIYRNMTGIASTSTSQNASGDEHEVEINGPILALSISPLISVKLDPPIRITIEHYLVNYASPSCRFWKFGSGNSNGYWSDEGCQVNVVYSTDHTTVCQCNHLTNFALLMSPFEQADTMSLPLSIISVVGISISMICLIITMAIHIRFWRILKNSRTIALMNLCSALLISYTLFLAGADRVENKVVCKVIAASLQYTYLAVFCLMLAEGIDIFIRVTYVFATESRMTLLICSAWVFPVLIVGVSLGATQAVGYGNENVCWLSIDNGLIWSFVGPALTIVLINSIIIVIAMRRMLSLKSVLMKSTVQKITTSVRSLCVLMPLTGISWVLGIFYVNQSTSFIQYLFAICNSVQGLFIFVFHCALNRQIRDMFMRKRQRFQQKNETKDEKRMNSTDKWNSTDSKPTSDTSHFSSSSIVTHL